MRHIPKNSTNKYETRDSHVVDKIEVNDPTSDGISSVVTIGIIGLLTGPIGMICCLPFLANTYSKTMKGQQEIDSTLDKIKSADMRPDILSDVVHSREGDLGISELSNKYIKRTVTVTPKDKDKNIPF
jgi:hypothetical protein